MILACPVLQPLSRRHSNNNSCLTAARWIAPSPNIFTFSYFITIWEISQFHLSKKIKSKLIFRKPPSVSPLHLVHLITQHLDILFIMACQNNCFSFFLLLSDYTLSSFYSFTTLTILSNILLFLNQPVLYIHFLSKMIYCFLLLFHSHLICYEDQ